jgi:hypothetical protein
LSSLKCAQCGLVNFANATTCKRCGQAMVVSSGPEGIVLSDGYVLPPPPTVGTPGTGVWRDKATLILSKDAELPARCVKCNAPATGPRLKKKLSWHHPAIYLLILVALLIYFVVAMVLRKTATVALGLCEEHRAKHRRNVLIAWLLVGLGVAGFILTIFGADTNFALLGILLLLAGTIYAVVAVRIITVAKIDEKFAWLKGINKDYLDELPQWPGG